MFIKRNLLKASNISFLNNIQKLEILAYAKKKCEENDYDSALFCGIKEKKFTGFETNNSLKVWDGNFLKDLNSASDLINTLMKSKENSLLFYPECIKEEITKKILNYKTNS